MKSTINQSKKANCYFIEASELKKYPPYEHLEMKPSASAMDAWAEIGKHLRNIFEIVKNESGDE